jgi:hypothetical protein
LVVCRKGKKSDERNVRIKTVASSPRSVEKPDFDQKPISSFMNGGLPPEYFASGFLMSKEM